MDGEWGRKIRQWIIQDNRLRLKNYLSRINHHIRWWCLRRVSDRNLASEVQKSWFIGEWFSNPKNATLDVKPQLETFLEKYRFVSTKIIAHYILSTVSTIKNTLQRELRMKQFTWCQVPHFLTLTRKIARVEALKEMFWILQESKANYFEEMVMNDEL
jgi:hypothetical protein